MSESARKALEKLLDRAERAWSRKSENAILSLKMSEASFKGYLELPSRRETDQFHAAMRAAERAGGIRIEWDKLAGEDGQILRIVLADREALASHLDRTPLWDTCRHAEVRLANFTHEGAHHLLKEWSQGKRPRGIGPERIDDLVDAVRILDGLTGYVGEDVPVRQYSAKLFNDSKHIEDLVPILDYLTAGEETSGMARTAEEVLGELGLIRHPQPALIAGLARIIFTNGNVIRIPSPYLGLAPQSVERIEVDTDARYILTVENYTTFNEICRGMAGPLEGAVLYTAGMPSPSFLTVYKKALANAPANIALNHWGDIDLGGYRIADVIANTARSMDMPVRLWNMNPAELAAHTAWRDLTDKEVGWIRSIAKKHGWNTEFQGVALHRFAYEQEMIGLTLPGRPD